MQQHLDEYQEYVVEGDNVIRMLRSDPYSADISLLPDSPSAQYKLALMEAVTAPHQCHSEGAWGAAVAVGHSAPNGCAGWQS